MRIMLAIRGLKFSDVAVDPWQKDTKYLEKILQCIDNTGFGIVLNHYGRQDSIFEKIESREKLLSESTAWEDGIYHLVTDKLNNIYDQPIRLTIIPEYREVNLTLVFQYEQVIVYPDILSVDNLIKLVCNISTLFKIDGVLGPFVSIHILDMDYPHVRPPRYSPYIVFSTIVNFFSKRYQAEEAHLPENVFQSICEAELPSKVQRIEYNDLIILKWLEDLSSTQIIAESCSMQEQWFINLLNPPIQSGYNEYGDYRVTVSYEKDDDITIYDSTNNSGYKTIVVFPDGSIDEELFQTLQQWVSEGFLPSGKPLKKLFLITQSRSAALKIKDKVTESGFSGVLYTDNQRNLWNPDPPGLWLTSTE